MRRVTICWVLFAGLAAAACDRAGTAASANGGSSPTGTPDSAAAAGATRSGDRAATMREVTLPAGTHLPIVLDTTVGSDISKVEEPVRAHLARAIDVQGTTVLPEGTRLSGVVTEAVRSAKVKGRAHVAIRFDTLVPAGQDDRYRIDTSAVGRTAPSTKKKDALEIGGGAAGGALIGALIGGGKGAAIGSAAGGGAGTAVVLSTRGKEVHLPKGARLTLRLSQPVTVRVGG